MRVATKVIACAVVVLGIIPTSTGHADNGNNGKQPPIPAPKGPIFRVPASGSVTYDANTGAIVSAGARAAAATPDGTVPEWNPSETVTVTRKEFSAKPSIGAARSIKPTNIRPMASASGCATYTWQSGSSLLWGKMSQTYCWNGGWVSYWPQANCWGYSSMYAPSYAYMGCHTSQLYGYGWNQGRTTWDADLCPLWVPLWGACATHDYVHHTYYFSNTGSAWRI